VKIGVMNFIDSAAFWSQSIESILQRCSWSDLCTAICSYFECDQQNSLNRQFFRLKQTVAEYIEKFDELINQSLLMAHVLVLMLSLVDIFACMEKITLACFG
jgi:hypothetical protein